MRRCCSNIILYLYNKQPVALWQHHRETWCIEFIIRVLESKINFQNEFVKKGKGSDEISIEYITPQDDTCDKHCGAISRLANVTHSQTHSYCSLLGFSHYPHTLWCEDWLHTALHPWLATGQMCSVVICYSHFQFYLCFALTLNNKQHRILEGDSHNEAYLKKKKKNREAKWHPADVFPRALQSPKLHLWLKYSDSLLNKKQQEPKSPTLKILLNQSARVIST